jgi:DNA-binding MarR family transcriptional regulator
MTPKNPVSDARGSAVWTYLTNHSHVLLCLFQDPYVRLREVAERVGITERAVQRIVSDLEQAGAIERIREGRRNRYVIDTTVPLRHSLESHRNIGEVLSLMTSGKGS